MVSLADAPVNLFGDKLPSFDEIKTLWQYVNSGEATRIAFHEQAAGNGDALVSGIGLLLCGDTKAAIEKLNAGADCMQKQMALGYAHRLMSDFDASIKAFDAAAKSVDGPAAILEKCETYRAAENYDAAKEALDSCGNFANVSAEYHYQLGKLQDALGEYETAMDNYETAFELDECHARAIFQLAFSYDLRGDEEEAAHYYREVVKLVPVHVNALLNLAVLYEDTGDYDKAEACVESVLISHPNHAKALLFYKDIKSSTVMIYDEEHEKRKSRHHKTLEIPISDFELSVRSRNCLKKMNIITLGDLLKTSEAELLSYKNFGETSLFEIKKILDIKGLRLGMALEEQGAAKPIDPEIASQASPEILEKGIGELELSVRARRALDRLGVKSILELISKTEAELLGCKNFGVTSLNEIKERLTDMGLNLRKLE
ncbi:MAG: DNA-directed RNA polymerase subunit alpha C-terminal domain-containing protein [Planctomycetota bacterium]|jgi:DNA-directed RNA polymerase subunit alpha